MIFSNLTTQTDLVYCEDIRKMNQNRECATDFERATHESSITVSWRTRVIPFEGAGLFIKKFSQNKGLSVILSRTFTFLH
jgi:hypothetical protein